jgi:hypothetical protein
MPQPLPGFQEGDEGRPRDRTRRLVSAPAPARHSTTDLPLAQHAKVAFKSAKRARPRRPPGGPL